MFDFVYALMSSFGAGDLWLSIAPAATLVGIAIVVGFTFVMLSAAIRDLGRASEAGMAERARREKSSWGDDY